MDRRLFLGSAAASTLLPAIQGSGFQEAEHSVAIIDTHVHCFAGGADRRFPYHPNGPYQPTESTTPEELLTAMSGAGVDFAVIVHPEPYQDDHRYLEHCLEVGQGKLKGTSLFFADRPDACDRMTELVERHQGRIVATRIHAYAPDRLPPFGTPQLKRLWECAARLGLVIQLHFEPRYAPGFEPLIREFADTRVVIDHLGRPFQGTPEEHARVIQWSRLPNTVMKLSSLPEPTQYPHREIAPVIRDLCAAYGPARLIYGGGFNAGATAVSYRAARERLRTFLTGFGEEDQARVLGGNAARLFGFPETLG